MGEFLVIPRVLVGFFIGVSHPSTSHGARLQDGKLCAYHLQVLWPVGVKVSPTHGRVGDLGFWGIGVFFFRAPGGGHFYN